MKLFRYDPATSCLVEQPGMEKPNATDVLGPSPSGMDYEVIDTLVEEYEEYLKTLRSYHTDFKEWGTGDLVEGRDFMLRNVEKELAIGTDYHGSPIYKSVFMAEPIRHGTSKMMAKPEQATVVKCICDNSLEYSDCDRKCDRVRAEQPATLSIAAKFDGRFGSVMGVLEGIQSTGKMHEYSRSIADAIRYCEEMFEELKALKAKPEPEEDQDALWNEVGGFALWEGYTFGQGNMEYLKSKFTIKRR